MAEQAQLVLRNIERHISHPSLSEQSLVLHLCIYIYLYTYMYFSKYIYLYLHI